MIQSQKNRILDMLLDKPYVCVTEMMSAYIPDFRRRICDLKDDGYILTGRSCQQHEHKSKNLKEWHLISAPQDRRVSAQTSIVATPSELSPTEQFYKGLKQEVLFVK